MHILKQDVVSMQEAKARIEKVIGVKLPMFGVGKIEHGEYQVLMADYRKFKGYDPVVAVEVLKRGVQVDRFNIK